MRHSGLRISDTTALACVSLTAGDHLQLYQAKTGESVSVLLRTFVTRVAESHTPKPCLLLLVRDVQAVFRGIRVA